MSYNPWLYAFANPIMLTDPSGMIPQPEDPCDRLPPEDAYWCKWARECKESCPEPPLVTHNGPVHQSYKALLETPCDKKNNKLNPWWLTRGALQKNYAPMNATMLVAILIYTESAPISPVSPQKGGDPEVRDAWIKMITNLYAYHCSHTGSCNISNNGRELGDGLSTFLSWSPRFRYSNKNYDGLGTSSIYIKPFGEPSWAYGVAENVVGYSGSYHYFNTQTDEEQKYFLNAYKKIWEGKHPTRWCLLHVAWVISRKCK